MAGGPLCPGPRLALQARHVACAWQGPGGGVSSGPDAQGMPHSGHLPRRPGAWFPGSVPQEVDTGAPAPTPGCPAPTELGWGPCHRSCVTPRVPPPLLKSETHTQAPSQRATDLTPKRRQKVSEMPWAPCTCSDVASCARSGPVPPPHRRASLGVGWQVPAPRAPLLGVGCPPRQEWVQAAVGGAESVGDRGAGPLDNRGHCQPVKGGP